MKKIIAALISLTLFYSSTVCVFAIENQECPYYEEIADVIELKKGPVLYLNEKRNDTYWEFSDNEEAFKTINSLEHDLISILSTNYNLDNLEKSNWLDYKNALENEISLNHISESFHTQRLLTFFNVCDNCDLNNEIRQIVKTDNYSMDELAVLMPYTSPYYKEYERKATINTCTTMNVTNAINYADKWASSYNYSYACFINGDCTNFASQIARAGGISNRSNWYYNSTQSYSTSWVRADTFVKTWKVAYSTTSFKTFSNKVSKGKFIAYDSEADGKWNHVAFVTAIGSQKSNYRDFKIAQHTKNYHAWVSSDTNGWENVSGLKAIINTPN